MTNLDCHTNYNSGLFCPSFLWVSCEAVHDTEHRQQSLRIKNFPDEKGSQTLNALAPSKARMGSSDLLNYFHGKLLIPTEFRKTLNIYMRI